MEVDEFLEHYGVRGMHWGIRKDRGSSGGTRIRSQRTFTGYYGSNNKNSLKGVGLNLLSHVGGFPLAALATSVISPMSMAYHTSRREIKHEIKNINKKYTSPGHDIRVKKSLQNAYNKDVQKSIATAINREKSPFIRPLRALANARTGKHVNTKYDVDFYMTNSWNKAAFIVLTSPKGQKKDLRVGFAKHANEEDFSVLHLEVELPRDENGLITDFIIPELENVSDNLSQSDAVVEFLEHFGVRGMHWGVRKGHVSALGILGGSGVGVHVEKGTDEEHKNLSDLVHAVRTDPKVEAGFQKVYDESFKSYGKYAKNPTPENYNSYRKDLYKGYTKVWDKALPKGLSSQIHFKDGEPSVFVIGNTKGLSDTNKMLKSRGFAHDDVTPLALQFTMVETKDSSGKITDISLQENVTHTDPVSEFLEHYGIRGMHWGIRRSKAELSRGSSGSSSGKPPWQSAPVRKPPPSIAGHSPHTPHDQVVYEALKAKAREHGIHSLSNEEIRILTNRAETLRKAYTAFPKKQTKTQKLGKRAGKIIDNVLINTGEQLLKDVVKFKGENILIDKGKLPPRKKRVVTETSVN